MADLGRTPEAGTSAEDDGDSALYRPAKRLKAALVPNLFAQFTALANEHKAVNLGQGFPSYGSPAFLKKAVEDAMTGDVFSEHGAPAALGNQYTRPGGEPGLAQTIAKEYSARFGRKLDPMKEVVTTIGAQEGIFTTMFAWTDPGDEILLFTPCFDAIMKSAPAVGLTVKAVSMRASSSASGAADWEIDLEELERAITPRTRALYLTNPSSPLGKVFSHKELAGIADVVRRHPRLLVISDEVYERFVYGSAQHVHFGTLPGMFERTMTLFSAGKTFSCTGWRVGYIIAPAPLAAPLLASHAAMNFCVPTPFQKAITSAFSSAAEEGYFTWLPGMMKNKLDALVKVLREIGLNPMVPDGGYFIVCDASVMLNAAGITAENADLGPATPLDERPDVRLCKWLTQHVGVTSIPVSPFFLPEDRHLANRLIRFAFCKDEASLTLAAERLQNWHRSLNGGK